MGDDGKAAAASDDLDFLMSVADLSNDVVEGVRIGVARFATIIYGVLENCCKCVMKIESVWQNDSSELRILSRPSW